MPIHSVHPSIDPPESVHIIFLEDHRQWSPGPLVPVRQRCRTRMRCWPRPRPWRSAGAGPGRGAPVHGGAGGVVVGGDVVEDMSWLAETAGCLGREAGVSEKTCRAVDEMGFLAAGADADGIPWSKAMLQWQHTGFHFQPEKNWMNGAHK
ncbi:hypothetical protein CFC21_041948 [Triticum aestivum]|uniref:Uncharacterized protein n=2 Tax=Triticum aestivum TaxID=4565 RepID=A0A3B6FT67_WHEAT|nr:uncharacterized protein LOC123065593 [Triticum aestivum]KAF7030407.1 hypothetical protein CFC21_041948 [Triticum aestivum]